MTMHGKKILRVGARILPPRAKHTLKAARFKIANWRRRRQGNPDSSISIVEIGPNSSAELAELSVSPEAILQVRLDLDGMTGGPKVLLEGLDQSGATRLRRWLSNDRTTYKTSFINDGSDTRYQFRLTNVNDTPVLLAIKTLTCEKIRDKPSGFPPVIYSETSTTVSMATYPLRANTLPDAVDSLVDQCDNLMIYLNNYRDVPAFLTSHPQRDKIHYILDTASDLRAAAKFTWCSRPGYHVIADDDIIYPKDYVSTLLERVNQYRREAIVGVHAANLYKEIPARGNHRSEVFRFQEGLPQDRPVNLLGTGTIAFHSDTVKNWDWSIMLENRISNDEALAVLAKRENVPLIAVARKKGWMKSHEAMNFGIYEEKALIPGTNDKVLAFLRANQPWPIATMPEAK
ncbi:hypothetical protein JYP52_16515 [Nitratireductor aquibiodomus]|uniref:hypothetical protein n=1 Tax=Nitratireductor aquibiodomus TaxID=204799 RepID=UPI0019D335EC|nr:hypothetical protein [Nitratireductor aquibiodomus]MBN7762746.1 hypothetical protein [Nitratireductor aquibiodomus]